MSIFRLFALHCNDQFPISSIPWSGEYDSLCWLDRSSELAVHCPDPAVSFHEAGTLRE